MQAASPALPRRAGGSSPRCLPAAGPCRRLRDFLGERPEEQSPLARVLAPELPPPFEPDSTPQRVLRALENAPASSVDPDSAPPSSLKAACPPARGGSTRPLSLSMAVETLATGSPRQADGVAQYMATKAPSARAGGAAGSGARPSAQQQQPAGAARRGQGGAAHRMRISRSSFLKRPLASAADIYSSF